MISFQIAFNPNNTHYEVWVQDWPLPAASKLVYGFLHRASAEDCVSDITS